MAQRFDQRREPDRDRRDHHREPVRDWRDHHRDERRGYDRSYMDAHQDRGSFDDARRRSYNRRENFTSQSRSDGCHPYPQSWPSHGAQLVEKEFNFTDFFSLSKEKACCPFSIDGLTMLRKSQAHLAKLEEVCGGIPDKATCHSCAFAASAKGDARMQLKDHARDRQGAVDSDDEETSSGALHRLLYTHLDKTIGAKEQAGQHERRLQGQHEAFKAERIEHRKQTEDLQGRLRQREEMHQKSMEQQSKLHSDHMEALKREFHSTASELVERELARQEMHQEQAREIELKEKAIQQLEAERSLLALGLAEQQKKRRRELEQLAAEWNAAGQTEREAERARMAADQKKADERLRLKDEELAKAKGECEQLQRKNGDLEFQVEETVEPLEKSLEFEKARSDALYMVASCLAHDGADACGQHAGDVETLLRKLKNIKMSDAYWKQLGELVRSFLDTAPQHVVERAARVVFTLSVPDGQTKPQVVEKIMGQMFGTAHALLISKS